MIAVIGITDVLLARMASGRACRSISAKNFCLSAKSSEDRLDDIIGVANRVGKVNARAHARDGAFIVAEIAQVRRDARLHGVEDCRNRVGDRHLMAGKRKHLRDAVAHEAGADDGDTRLLAIGQPAV